MQWRTRVLLLLSSIFYLSITQADTPMLDKKFNIKYHLSTESQLSDNFSPEINNFWNRHAQVNTFESEHGGTIHTVHIKTGQTKAVVISQGRKESVLKYKELAFDFYNQGYDVFLIDHRGQGFSSRLGGDAHRGHVQTFNHYVSDLTTFINSLQLTTHYSSRFLLGHSMGGAINALYLEENKHPFQAAAFFSPMFSIDLGLLPHFIAKIISYISDLICRWFSELACYAPGVGPYTKGNFDGNKLTHSEKRYASAFSTFDHVPQTQLGGVTMRWVNESLFASEKAIDNASLINIPVLILQAGADTIVSDTGQQQFIDNSQHCIHSKLLHIAGAKHEILLEEDKYRLPAITATFDFFQQSQQRGWTCIK